MVQVGMAKIERGARLNNEAIKKISHHYGYDAQSRQLIEEMAELTVALNKYYRQDKSDVITAKEYLDVQYLFNNIKEEIADVTIMLEQIKYLLNISDTDIEQIIEQKLNRQLERIEKNE